MKIALIVDSIESLGNWQLRIIDKLRDNLTLFIVDNTQIEDKNTILMIQESIENKIFSKSNNKEYEKLLIDIKKTPAVSIDNHKIKEQSNIDLIIDLSLKNSHIELSNYAQYGLWKLFFCKESFNYKEAQLLNIVKKNPLSTIELISYQNSKAYFVDIAKINISFSLNKSLNELLETSATLIIKYLNILENSTMQLCRYEETKNNYKLSNLDSLKYINIFYKTLFQKVYKRVNHKLFKTRYDCWSLFTLEDKNIINADLSKLNPLMPRENEFWADPFICKKNNNTYVFFENYNYETKLGKISCGILKNNELVNIVDVLEKEYHLSYPFIYRENDEIFMIPEMSENRKLEIYKCIEFPYKWELYSTAFEGEKLLDTFIYRDKDENLWLFTNKQTTDNSPVDSELYIYKIDSLKLETLEPHKKNPVLINSEIARNGGTIFEYNGEIFRPSQCNIDGVYGKYLNINKIITLTLENYKESRVKMIESSFNDNLISCHHLHQSGNSFIIDAAYKKLK